MALEAVAVHTRTWSVAGENELYACTCILCILGAMEDG